MKALFLFLLVPVLAWSYPLVPDKSQTPGSVCTERHSDFDEHRYPEKIPHCDRNVEGDLKTRIYDWYKIPRHERKNYTIDHLIPLSIGGDNEPKNLWPEHRAVKATRPHLEEQVHQELSDGRITQQQAIQRILKAKFSTKGLEEYEEEEEGEEEEDSLVLVN